MNPTEQKQLNKILNTIDNSLAKGGKVAHALWNILSALRGPDNGNFDLKDTTTCILRSATFPKTAKALTNDDLVLQPTVVLKSLEEVKVEPQPNNYPHFHRHIAHAKKDLLAINRNPFKEKV